MIKFSICIPNFNYGDYIEMSIRSALDQTYPPHEVIVVDNASTDNSWEVINSIKSDRLKVFRNNLNVGFAPNLQKASEKATGDYIILLSSDDLMLPHALEAYAKVLEEQGDEKFNTVVYGTNNLIDKEENWIGVVYKKKYDLILSNLKLKEYRSYYQKGLVEELSANEILKKSLELLKNPFPFQTTCYPRKLWEKVEGYATGYYFFPDYAFVLKLLAANPRIKYCHDSHFAYRKHGGGQEAQNKSFKALKQQVDGYLLTLNLPEDVLKQAGVTRETIIKRFFYRDIAFNGALEIANNSWMRAFRIFLFGWATYPKFALKYPNMYLLGILLALGPVGKSLVRFAQRYKYHMRKVNLRKFKSGKRG